MPLHSPSSPSPSYSSCSGDSFRKMDFSFTTRLVHNRIQKLEPKLASKIIGFLLLQEHGEQEMLRLAYGPEAIVHSAVNNAKSELGLSPKPAAPVSEPALHYTPYSASSCSFASQSLWEPQIGIDPQNVHNLDFLSSGRINSVGEGGHGHSRSQFMGLEDQLDSATGLGAPFSHNYYYPDQVLGGNLNVRTSRRSPSMPDIPFKTCHYHSRGFCKHGSNCRFFHGQIMLDSSQMISASYSEVVGSDEHIFLPGSLEQLEIELVELLKSRRGAPVSIAALPMLYFEKYGRNLQAEGYLTESQRHGKAGFSLTRLLVRLKNSIRLIDRPHGQHSVILAEDLPRFMERKSERNDHGAIVAGSRQIYLTFPAESTFSEDDVSEYFNTYGPVEDVRIPSQQKRMFGFVTFVYAETVKLILTKGNPHFVCGARVLVKPYREKSRLDRKYVDKLDPSMHCSTRLFEMDCPQLYSGQSVYDNPRLLHKQLIEDHGHALELERRRLSEFQFAAKPPTQLPYPRYPVMDDVKITDQSQLLSADHIDYILDVLNSGASNDEKARNAGNNCGEEESQGANLPESPFTSPIKSSIPTLI